VSRYDWMADALCAQTDANLWHAEKGANYTTAKRICNRCPVQPQCVDHTARLDAGTPGRHGVWAAQTHSQRKAAQGDVERRARQARDEVIVRLLERGGMDPEEIAAHVGVNVRTVSRIKKIHREQGVSA
jgi:WhiB family redox-sensing transcriptional regulator